MDKILGHYIWTFDAYVNFDKFDRTRGGNSWKYVLYAIYQNEIVNNTEWEYLTTCSTKRRA